MSIGIYELHRFIVHIAVHKQEIVIHYKTTCLIHWKGD